MGIPQTAEVRPWCLLRLVRCKSYQTGMGSSILSQINRPRNTVGCRPHGLHPTFYLRNNFNRLFEHPDSLC